MIIDIHAHIWAGSYEEDKKEIIKTCELYNISKVYISGFKKYFPDEEDVHETNYETCKFMKEYTGLIEGFCYINPHLSNWEEELKRGIEEYGMSGMKMVTDAYFDNPVVYSKIERCIEYKIPILQHAFHKATGQIQYESVGTHIANLARRYPEAKIIMAHLDGNCYHGIKAIKDCKNVWVDISGSIFRRDDIDYTKELIGAERILFGSDLPGTSFLTNYGLVEEADLTNEEKELIYYKNAIKIINRD